MAGICLGKKFLNFFNLSKGYISINVELSNYFCGRVGLVGSGWVVKLGIKLALLSCNRSGLSLAIFIIFEFVVKTTTQPQDNLTQPNNKSWV